MHAYILISWEIFCARHRKAQALNLRIAVSHPYIASQLRIICGKIFHFTTELFLLLIMHFTGGLRNRQLYFYSFFTLFKFYLNCSFSWHVGSFPVFCDWNLRQRGKSGKMTSEINDCDWRARQLFFVLGRPQTKFRSLLIGLRFYYCLWKIRTESL